MATVGKNQNETVIKEYVKNQGKQEAEYEQIYLKLQEQHNIAWGRYPAFEERKLSGGQFRACSGEYSLKSL